MAKATLGKAVWQARTERTSDGWLIRVFNRGLIPGSFFLQNVDFKVEKGQAGLVDGAKIELISEQTANPGGEITFKLTVKQASLLELAGSSMTLDFGTGMGQYYRQITLNLS